MKASRGRGNWRWIKEKENKWKKLLTIRCRDTSSHLHVQCWIGWSMPFYTRDSPNCKICIIYNEEMETKKNAAHNFAHHSACRNRKFAVDTKREPLLFSHMLMLMWCERISFSCQHQITWAHTKMEFIIFFTRQGSEKLVNHRLRTAHRLDEIVCLSSRSQSFGYFKRNSLSGAHHILILLHTAYYYLRAFLKPQIQLHSM